MKGLFFSILFLLTSCGFERGEMRHPVISSFQYEVDRDNCSWRVCLQRGINNPPEYLVDECVRELGWYKFDRNKRNWKYPYLSPYQYQADRRTCFFDIAGEQGVSIPPYKLVEECMRKLGW